QVSPTRGRGGGERRKNQEHDPRTERRGASYSRVIHPLPLAPHSSEVHTAPVHSVRVPLANLDVNLDDLQSEIEATSRAAKELEKEAGDLDRTMPAFRTAQTVGEVIRRSREL